MPMPPSQKDYYLGFNYLFDMPATMQLMLATEAVIRNGATRVTFCLSSNGGDPDQAIYAANLLAGLPVEINTFAIGPVRSAAVTMFLAGKRRYATANANFLFHHTTVTPAAAQRAQNHDDILGNAELMKQNDKASIDWAAAQTKQPRDRVEKWFEGQRTRDVEFAKANGIIDEIRPLTVPQGAEFLQIPYKF